MPTEDVFEKCGKQEKVCLFSDMTSSSLVLQSQEVREYMAREMPTVFKAMAVLSKKTLEKVSPIVFVHLHGQPIPIENFSDEKEAKEWLKQYL